MGSRPVGSDSPTKMSASASAPSSPGYHGTSTAPARSAHGISIGEPALTTTTVRGLAATTASTSSRCRPGSDRSCRSCPSDSHCPLDPTTTTATSAAAAASTARSNSSPRSGVAAPIRAPMMGEEAERGHRSHRQLVRAAGLELVVGLDGLAARAVEPLAPVGLGVVDDHVAVDAQHGTPGALQPQPPPPRHVGREDAAYPHGAPARSRVRAAGGPIHMMRAVWATPAATGAPTVRESALSKYSTRKLLAVEQREGRWRAAPGRCGTRPHM